jgi:tetratricopeptide (TPR) repeat protein
LNVRLAGFLLLGILGSGAAVHGLHYVQIHRHAEAFKAAAEQAKDANDLKGAIEHLKSYVGLQPSDVSAQQKLAFWLAEAKNYRGAFMLLEEMLRKAPDSTEGRRKLVEVAIAMQPPRWSDAEEHLKILLRDDAKNPALLDLRGQCEMTRGALRTAAETFRQAIHLAPATTDPYLHLIFALRRLDQAQEADKVMQQLVANNPTSVSAQVLYCQYLLLVGRRFEEASQQAQKVIRLAPQDVRGPLLAGQCALERQRFDEAIRYAEEAIHMSDTSPDGYLLLADSKKRMGRSDEALAALERGLGRTAGTTGYTSLLWSVANLHLDNDKPLAAQKLLAQLKDLTQNAAVVRCLAARIEMALGHWTAALTAFEALRPELGDARQPELLKRVDLWIGQCYAQTGNIEQQLAAYRRAVLLDPTFFPARDGIAEILMNAGRYGEAEDEYRQAIRAGAPNEQVRLALVRTMVLRNLRLPAGERDWERVERAMREAEQVAPGSPQILLLGAEVLMDQGRLHEAEQRLRDLRKVAPDHVEFWIAQAVLDERQEKWEVAKQHLLEATARLGDCVQLRIARAHYLLRWHGPAAYREIRKLAEENLEKFSGEDRLRLWNNLIAYAIQANDYDTARRLCQRVADKEPNNVRIRYLLFELILRSGEYSQLEARLGDVDRVLDEMEKSGGRGPLWLYGRAMRLTLEAKGKDAPSLSQALRSIAKARETRPSWPPLPLLAAKIYEIQGKEDLMLENYVQAIKLGENDALIVRKAVQLLQQQQRYAEASEVVLLVQQRQGTVDLGVGRDMLPREIATGGKTLEEAERDLEKLVNIDSQDFKDHLWRGQMCVLLADRALRENRESKAVQFQGDAEKAFRRTLALKGTCVEGWVGLVRLLASAGHSGEALEAIAEFQQKKFPPEQTNLALAWMYESVGDTKEATRRYEQARAAMPTQPAILREVASFYLRAGKHEAAEALLKTLTNGSNKAATAETVAWARRMYALLLMERGGFPNLTAALQLIDQNVASPAGSVDDRRVKAQILLEDPRRTRLEEAVRTLEELIQGSTRVTPRDRFVLAQLYLRQGAWPKYLSQMKEVLGSRNVDPAFVTAHVRALLQHEELANADGELQSLERAAPNEFSTVSLRAELLVARKNYTAALELLKAYLEQSASLPASRTERQLLVGRAAEQLARKLAEARQEAAAKPFVQEAERQLRAYIAAVPDKEAVLASFLARQGRCQEALDLATKSWKTGNLEGLGMVAMAVIHGGGATDADLARLDEMLQGALTQFNRPLLLLGAVADSSLKQQRYAAAETVYREILKRDPQNVTALNNLSVMLAFEGKRLDEAVQLISQAVELAGPVPNVLDSRATVFMAVEKADEAIKDLDAAIADEATALRLFRRARAYLLAGKKLDALKSWQAAEKKNLKRAMLDPPERPLYDKLRSELQT